MEQKYTVEKVKELINENIFNNRYSVVDYRHAKFTYPMFIFLAIGKLIGMEKGCNDVISKLAENDDMFNVSEKSFIITQTSVSFLESSDKTKLTGKDVFTLVLNKSTASKGVQFYGYYLGKDRDYYKNEHAYPCKKSGQLAGTACGALIFVDGWQMKNDYPW